MQNIADEIYNAKILSNNKSVSWADVYYAVKENLFPADIVKDFAFHTVETNSSNDVYEILVSENPAEAFDVLETQMRRQQQITEKQRERSLRLIRLLVLKNLLKEDKNTLFEKAAIVYEDMGCPEDMDSFVYYMPSNDGYKPEKHTEKENKDRMLTFMKKFLDNEENALNLNQ